MRRPALLLVRTMQPAQFLVVWVFVGTVQIETAIVILEEGEFHAFANPALTLSLGKVQMFPSAKGTRDHRRTRNLRIAFQRFVFGIEEDVGVPSR